MSLTVLDRAKRSFSRGRYNDVITLLEPEVINYRDSFSFYYLLGLACLYTGDIGGAGSYFQRARQIKMRDADLLAAQAALYLRRGNTQQAVDYYLEILEYAPSHRLARRSLEFLRKHADEDAIADLVSSGKMKRFYPGLSGSRFRFGLAVGLPVALVAALLLLMFIPIFAKRASPSSRADLSAFELNGDERARLVETGGTARYILTSKEIEATWNKALSSFQDWNDNAAQMAVNRILGSNASVAVKQKARLLMTWFTEPGFDSIKERFTLALITTDPALYQDCWVVWKGMATNVTQTPTALEFDLLVGYDTRNKLEGIIPVLFEGGATVDTDTPLEVLGQVKIVAGRTALRVRAVHQTGRPVSR